MHAGFLQYKVEFGELHKNIEKIRSLTANEDFDLLVLPELANSGYLFSDKAELENFSEEIPSGDFCKFLFKLSKEKNAFIVSGICERKEDEFFNSSVLIKPDGGFDVYRKIHLYDREKLWFSAGVSEPEVYLVEKENSDPVRIGIMICFDWIFPETARMLALKGAQILCHPSNLVMPYCQRAMFTRALENQVFTITANRIGTEISGDLELTFTGESVILDPKGNYLCEAGRESEEIKIVSIDPSAALDKNLNSFNHLFNDRRKNLYNLNEL